MVKILLLMLLCHLLDDFFLQDKFSYLKQKSWWIKVCNDDGLNIEKYKNDYKMALFEHSLEWSIMIMLPVIFLLNINWYMLLLCVIINTIMHYVIDDMKANQLRLNLIQDQILHFLQVLITFIIVINI